MAGNEVTPLVTLPHPLSPAGQTICNEPFLVGETLGAYVTRNQIVLPRSVFRVQHNGRLVPMQLWERLIPRPGDHVLIYAVAEGGGDSTKVLASVAMIALMLSAPYLAELANGAMGFSTVAGSFAMTATTTAIMVGGSLLISALLPPPKPATPDNGKGDSIYTLAGGNNQMRQWEPMMLLFGRHKVVPDLAAAPYSEWVGKDQYLYQIFHFGLQPELVTLSNFKIGETDLATFTDYTLTVSGPDGKLAGFAGNVDTIAVSAELPKDVHVTRTTSTNTTKIGVALTGTIYYVNNDGDYTNHPATVSLRYRPVGTTSWISRPDLVLNTNKSEPSIASDTWAVPTGQYEIDVWKISADADEPGYSTKSYLSQILCYQTDTADYTGQLRVGLKIKASKQLNGTVDQLSAMASVKCPVWTGSAWETKETKNPAWWFLFFARGKIVDGVGRIYGCGYSDSRIDFDAIRAWAQFCDAKGLTFNYVLSGRTGTDAMLDMIARAGRASRTYQTGKLGVVWDRADMPVSAIFGPLNIRAGTFKVSYINANTPDEIVLNFINEATDYKTDTVRVKVPGETTAVNPLTMDMDGWTNRDAVGREANLIAAEQVWRRRQVEWECAIEGWTAHRGQVVTMTHDMTAWGISGRLMSRNGVDITLSHSLPTGSGIMLLRDPDGKMKTVSVSGVLGETDTVTIITPLDGFALPGDPGYEECDPLDWAFLFDPLQTPGRRFKITNVQPAGEFGVKFTAVDDAPEYYASENNPYQYTPPRDGASLRGFVLGVVIDEGWYNTLSRRLTANIHWAVSSDIESIVEIAVNDSRRPQMRTRGTSLSVPDLQRDDVLTVTITPVSRLGVPGTPVTQVRTIQAVAVAPEPVGSMSASIVAGQMQLSWQPSPEPDVVDYEVRDSDTGWGGSGYLYLGDATQCRTAPGPVGEATTWFVRAINAAGLYSSASASVSYTANAVPDVTGITHTFRDTSQTSATMTLSWAGVAPEFGLETYRVSYDAESVDVNATSITLPADWIGDRVFTIQTIDRVGQVSAGVSVSINKRVPDVPKNVRVQVIDNNVMLYWDNPAPTTLPVDHIMIRRGPDFGPAEEIGPKKGGFTTILELRGGMNTYWLSAVDTDGWESDPVAVVATVGEPPDFVFNGKQQSAFGGTITNGAVVGGALYLPVDTSQTWESHFTARSWAGPQDQITAGYPYFLQPTEAAGQYVEVFDFGTIVPSSKISVAVDQSVIAGSADISIAIETSEDGAAWSAPIAGLETFASAFRYVRLTLDVAQSAGLAIVRVSQMSVTLSSKLRNDAGSTDCLAADAVGTVANFNADFLDVQSITLSPAGTTPLTAVYDHKGAILSGTYSRVSGTITVNVVAHGLIAGQDVMLIYGNTDPERVTVDSASADQFTAASALADKAGSLQIYAQGMRIYLFDDTGARASGAVSWSVKGY